MDAAAELRRSELVAGLGAVRNRIAVACEASGRDVQTVTMIAVTKTYPATDAAVLARLGVSDLGESRDQEAAAKVADLERLLAEGPEPAPPVRWHFVGRLQSRKSRSVAGYAAAVHSVDRLSLVGPLAEGVARAARPPLEVFVQVSLDGDPARGGVLPEALGPLAEQVAMRTELTLRGVMAVAPLGAEPDAAFSRLAEIASRLQAEHPAADGISAGMSQDLEAAVRHGSTHVRVGTALLGRRPPAFG